MADSNQSPLSQAIRGAACPLTGESQDFDSFLAIIGDARLVLLGEATHGTHAFYRARAEIATCRSRCGSPAKVVVWAHNSHLGDTRATEMGWEGELTVGQLIRERFGHEAVLTDFTIDEGMVTAASDWSEPAARKRVRPAFPESYENLFHGAGMDKFLLNLRD